MYKQHYSTFFRANPGKLHFSAHSHHPWPDISREAHLRYWEDSATLTDQKWDHIFGKIIPEAQAHVARVLGFTNPGRICFAPNTHEFIARIFSCFDPKKPLRILTSDGEFHSFSRQVRRYEELPNIKVTRVPLELYENFEERVIEILSKESFDLVFLSHVFFVPGLAIKNITKVVRAVRDPSTIIVIDGYHAFCALPVNLSDVQDRIFYLGGGYKYAQAGEGACFLQVPKASTLRPLNTGWFAHFEGLEKSGRQSEPVAYGSDGYRFWGATFDPSGLYRLNGVMNWLKAENLTVSRIHEYVHALQKRFVGNLRAAQLKTITIENLILPFPDWHGHFLTFKVRDAKNVSELLLKNNISTDSRGDFLRFGFGIHLDEKDVDLLFEKLSVLKF